MEIYYRALSGVYVQSYWMERTSLPVPGKERLDGYLSFNILAKMLQLSSIHKGNKIDGSVRVSTTTGATILLMRYVIRL